MLAAAEGKTQRGCKYSSDKTHNRSVMMLLLDSSVRKLMGLIQVALVYKISWISTD